jgi:hypothetical protein
MLSHLVDDLRLSRHQIFRINVNDDILCNCPSTRIDF